VHKYIAGTPEWNFTRPALQKIAKMKPGFIKKKITMFSKIEVSPGGCPVPASLLSRKESS
jgi:hypothetical protein